MAFDAKPVPLHQIFDGGVEDDDDDSDDERDFESDADRFYRYRFIAEFTSPSDEKAYLNFIKLHPHLAHYHYDPPNKNEEYPRKCQITIFGNEESFRDLRSTKWFCNNWDLKPQLGLSAKREPKRFIVQVPKFLTSHKDEEKAAELITILKESQRTEGDKVVVEKGSRAHKLSKKNGLAMEEDKQVQVLNYSSLWIKETEIKAIDPSSLSSMIEESKLKKNLKVAILDTGLDLDVLSDDVKKRIEGKVFTYDSISLKELQAIKQAEMESESKMEDTALSNDEKVLKKLKEDLNDISGHGTHIFGIIQQLVHSSTKFCVGKISKDGVLFVDNLQEGVKWAINDMKANIVCIAFSPYTALTDSDLKEGDHYKTPSKICFAAGNNGGVCHWAPWMKKNENINLVGAVNYQTLKTCKDNNNTDSKCSHKYEFCKFSCDEPMLKQSYGDYTISHCSQQAHWKLKFNELSQFDLFHSQTDTPATPFSTNKLILQGTSQAAAFYAATLTWACDSEMRILYSVELQKKARSQ